MTDADGLTATQTLSLTVTTGPIVISATATPRPSPQGGTLTYTVTISNTGSTAYSGVNYSVPLSDVLDDAVYNSDAAATRGHGLATRARP